MEAFFESSVVLTFALPREQLERLIPPCLQLDTFEDKWAFIAIAMVQTKDLRPRGFPKFMGNDFFLVGYRVFVRYTDSRGKRLRGLYIIKSETDKRKMQVMGNIFTHYQYTTTDINRHNDEISLTISSVRSAFRIQIAKDEENVMLPAGSPFRDWKEARRFAGPLPFTFTFNPEYRQVLIIEGVRENWTPAPVHVIDYDIAFFETMQLERPVLANAFIIRNIPYYWKKGIIDQWK